MRIIISSTTTILESCCWLDLIIFFGVLRNVNGRKTSLTMPISPKPSMGIIDTSIAGSTAFLETNGGSEGWW